MQTQEYLREVLRKRADRLAYLADRNAPAVLIANELLLVFEAGNVLYGPEFWKLFGNRHTAHLRQRSGYCQTCDSRIPPQLAFAPLCEQCEARAEEEATGPDDFEC